jgi:hypothetical protein
MARKNKAQQVLPQSISEKLLRIEHEQEEKRNMVDFRLPPNIVKVLENIGISKGEAAKDGIKYTVNEADKNALTSLLNLSGFRMGTMVNLDYFRKRMRNNKIIYHNGCIFDLESGREVWYGDIDVSAGLGKLQDVAATYGKPFAITVEHPYRWQDRLDLTNHRTMLILSGKKSLLVPDPFYVEHPQFASTISKGYREFPHVVFIMPGEMAEEEMGTFIAGMLAKFNIPNKNDF